MARASLGTEMDFKYKAAQSQQYFRHMGVRGTGLFTEAWTVLEKSSFSSLGQ